MRKGKPRGWPGDMHRRLRFERGARRAYPSLRGRRVGTGFRYDVDVRTVPDGEVRHVVIEFTGRLDMPRVRSDGPTESPHRYEDGSLCMWYPRDPVSQRWVFKDGLLDLLDLTVNHLSREGIWRRTREWPGPEAPHDEDVA